MIDQPRPVRAADDGKLLAAGADLAVASAAADLLSAQIALSHAAPELLCFAGASPKQLTRLRHASDELTHTVVEFLAEVQPHLVAGARERIALAIAEAENAQSRAREATRAMSSRVPTPASPA